jgi:general stress protein 26
MRGAENEYDAADVDRLIAGAAKTMASVRYCWLATSSEDGGFSARPMGRLPREDGDAEWTIRLLTDGRSRKAAQIRRSARVVLTFQHDANDAFVQAFGAARLRESASEVLPRWKSAYDVYFPTEQDRASASFVEIEVERMELWIRGVTPEPFGLFPTVLERAESRGWRLAPRSPSAAANGQG